MSVTTTPRYSKRRPLVIGEDGGRLRRVRALATVHGTGLRPGNVVWAKGKGLPDAIADGLFEGVAPSEIDD